MKLSPVYGLALFVGVAFGAEKTAGPRWEALYYYDLGPAEVDVSAYPPRHQRTYTLFTQACSQCHTLSRAINSPLLTSQDWQRFVTRMHTRIDSSPKWSISAEERRRIVDFLVYDAKIRKVDRKEEFDGLTEQLKKDFTAMNERRFLDMK